MGRVLFIVVGGFLGAGKTTALSWLAQSLERLGKRTAVVMNDQGELLVDSALGRSLPAQIISVGLSLAAGAAVYGVAVTVMRIPEAEQIRRLVGARLGRGRPG